MSEILKPLGQWDTAVSKGDYLWVSPDGVGWLCTGIRSERYIWTTEDAAHFGLTRTPLGAELESLRVDTAVRDVVADAPAKHEARTEYVTRDELAEKLDEVYQAIRDVDACVPECGAAPERPMPGRPPIPPEPTGFGAIVRDVDGDHWARTREGRWLALIPGGGKRTWDDVAMHGPLTVVSEGVES